MIVTAFILNKDKTVKKSVEHYLNMFHHVASLGLPTILFLDRSLSGFVNYKNVRVVYTDIRDLEYFKFLNEQTSPPIFNAPRESELLDYFTVINSKTEFMMRAMDICSEERFSWIDFGVAHMLNNPAVTLQQLWKASYLRDGLVIPGGHPVPVPYQKDLIWRFLGTFFSGTRKDIEEFHKYQVQAYRSLYPIVDLEVKVWCHAEAELGFKPVWYESFFGPSLLNFDALLDYSKVLQ
jgi:hypothetical protein